MTAEPRHVSGPLAEARAKVAAQRAAGPPPGDDLEGDDLEQIRAQGVEQMRRQRWLTMIPSRFQWASLDDLADDVAGLLGEWSAKPAGRNLVLTGPVGTGKTHAAVAACRPPFARGMEVAFLPIVEALDQLRPGGDPHALEDLTGCDLLLLDDLGSERPTDWTAERLFAVVNRRWLEERPTIATTNLETGQGGTLMQAVGERTYSRLVGNDAVVVRLTGADRRRKQA